VRRPARAGHGRSGSGRSRLAALALALLAGLAAGLAHPPFGILPGLLGLALLLRELDRPDAEAFRLGWAAGFAYFLSGTWWVGEAFLVDVAAHGWQAPFAVVLLPVGIGLFWGAAAWSYRRIAPAGAARVLVFAATFGLFEWLRGHVLSGFPWNLVGEAWAAGSAPSQAAAVLGAYGLTTVTLALAAAPATLFPHRGPRRFAPTVLAALVLAGMWGAGAVRLAGAASGPDGLRLRIVQPDIPQADKWSDAAFRNIVERYARMTAEPAAPGAEPQVVVWPESAIPDWASAVLAPDTWTRDALFQALKPGQTLLFGILRADAAGGEVRYYNSFLALRRTQDDLVPLGFYDKHRLVPFGEYLPFERWLEPIGLKKLAAVGESFSAGPQPRPLDLPGIGAIQPLICYESLFPGFARSQGGRPDWIVNVSNDAWFGRTSGPWQHLNLASYRAIEEGVPIVRATPTGVSALVDAYGRVKAKLPLGSAGRIDARLPPAAAPTLFARFGDAFFWGLEALGFAFVLLRRARKGTEGT
jgi:apolipoprotein N-acyltransferase